MSAGTWSESWPVSCAASPSSSARAAMPLHPVSRLSRLQLHNLARAVASSPLPQPAQPLAGVKISVDGDSPNARSMNANKESRDKTFRRQKGAPCPLFSFCLCPPSLRSLRSKRPSTLVLRRDTAFTFGFTAFTTTAFIFAGHFSSSQMPQHPAAQAAI